jgi:hypothetical protein
LVRALSSLDESWEAGEMPALPRNCKRGNLPPLTGQVREEWRRNSIDIDLTRKPGDRRESQ